MKSRSDTFSASIPCIQPPQNGESLVKHAGFELSILHKPEDPQGVNRIFISQKELKIELLPSKGLTVREAFYKDRPLFWEPPAELFDPDTLVLDSDEILINGVPNPGATYIKTYTGGIEFLGLSNWGMHYSDPDSGEVKLLHGEVASIPVEEITVTISAETLELKGSFIVRTCKGGEGLPWYQRGEARYEVTRTIILTKDQPTISLTDHISNISHKVLTPDWGYHVTLRPEKEAELLIPSKTAKDRSGEPVSPNHEKWYPSEQDSHRIEHGIIHTGLKISPHLPDGKDGVRTLLKYPDSSGIAVTISPPPYFQTWFCSGGTGSKEFSYADGTPVLKKHWDGQGIEFGSSSLDHDGNIDPAIQYDSNLAPGESMDIHIHLEVLSPEATLSLADEIREYNRHYRK